MGYEDTRQPPEVALLMKERFFYLEKGRLEAPARFWFQAAITARRKRHGSCNVPGNQPQSPLKRAITPLRSAKMKRLYVLLFLGLFAFAAGTVIMMVTADQAQACSDEGGCGHDDGYDDGGHDDWDDAWHDCGCNGDDDADVKVDVDVDVDVNVDVDVTNNNVNNNTNNNVNNNVNNITIVNDITNQATANANALSAAVAASQAGGRLSGNNLRDSVFGRERRGAGGTIVNAARAPITIGPLRVVVKEERVSSRAVRGVCLDGKGLEEAAYLASNSTHVNVSKGSGELMYCQMGDALVVTIGEVDDSTGRADYAMGQVIECLDGQALRFGNGGRLACGPASNTYFAGNDRASHARFAEIFLARTSSGYAQEEVSYRGATTYNGGVGY